MHRDRHSHQDLEDTPLQNHSSVPKSIAQRPSRPRPVHQLWPPRPLPLVLEPPLRLPISTVPERYPAPCPQPLPAQWPLETGCPFPHPGRARATATCPPGSGTPAIAIPSNHRSTVVLEYGASQPEAGRARVAIPEFREVPWK